MKQLTFSFRIPQDLPDEIWLPVVGYEGYYEVSNMGRVRTLKKRKSVEAGYILGKHQIPQGYCYVRLSIYAQKKFCYVHRLVLAAFAPVEGYEDLDVNHKNGQRDDNRLENLEWLSHKANMKYSRDVLKTFENFGTKKGQPPANAKMTPEMVKEIRAMAALGIHYKEIAKLYPMTPSAIHHIISRKTWKNIE